MKDTETRMELLDASVVDAVGILEVQKLAFHGQAVLYNDFTLPPLTQTLDEFILDFERCIVLKALYEGRIAGLRSLPPIAIDYVPPLGDGQGYLPLEMLLMSLGACSGGTIGLLLRKMGKTLSGIKVYVRGTRLEQHPTSFEKILMEFTVNSSDVNDADMRKSLKLAEESVCPVWAMVKGNAEIAAEYTIIAA
jgi:putative redox protein